MKAQQTHTGLLLATTMAVGVGLRMGVAYSLGDAITELPGTYDQLSYDTLARQVLGGHGFSFPSLWWPATRAGEPTAHWSFLYTLYLAATYALFDGHAMVARMIQAVVAGALYPWFAWRLGRRLFGAPAGLAAAGLMAVYGYFVYYAGALMTETFYIVAILWALDIALGIAQRPNHAAPRPSHPVRAVLQGALPWLLLGLALGMAALLRQLVLLFVPVLFAWLLWSTTARHRRSRESASQARWRPVVGRLVLTTAVIALLIGPWALRNYQAFDRFVLLNTNAGYAFFWANHPLHGTDFVPIWPSWVYQRLIPSELLELDEAALDQALLQEGVRFVVQDPARYALLAFSRIKAFFQFWPTPESSATSNLLRTLSFGLCLPLMLYGLVLAGIRHRSSSDHDAWCGVVLLYLFVAIYCLVHLLSWSLIRYRLPVDAVLVPFAGLAIVDLASRARARSTVGGHAVVVVSAPR